MAPQPNLPVPPRVDGDRFTSDANIAATFASLIAARQLWVPRCPETGSVLELSLRVPVDRSLAQIVWTRASGAATLYAYTIYRRQYDASCPVPYNVAIVELAEGLRLVSTVVSESGTPLRAGMSLTSLFEATGRLVFAPAA